MSHVKPVPVTLRRWGASISASLVLLACGGVADLQLGQDSNALESAADDAPSAGTAAPTPGTADGAPQSGAGSAVAPATGLVPGQVYLVDPTTGQVFVPCQVPLPDGVATDAPVPAVPATEPVPASDEPPQASPAAGTAAYDVPTPPPAAGASAGAAPAAVAHRDEAGGEPATTPARDGQVATSAAGGQPAPDWEQPVVTPTPSTGAVSLQPCSVVGGIPVGGTQAPQPPQSGTGASQAPVAGAEPAQVSPTSSDDD